MLTDVRLDRPSMFVMAVKLIDKSPPTDVRLDRPSMFASALLDAIYKLPPTDVRFSSPTIDTRAPFNLTVRNPFIEKTFDKVSIFNKLTSIIVVSLLFLLNESSLYGIFQIHSFYGNK